MEAGFKAMQGLVRLDGHVGWFKIGVCCVCEQNQ